MLGRGLGLHAKSQEKLNDVMRLLRTHSVSPLVMLLVGFAMGIAMMTALFSIQMMMDSRDTPIRHPVARDCACGPEFNHLKRLARIALYRHEHKVNSSSFSSLHPSEDLQNLSQYIHPGAETAAKSGVPIGVPYKLRQEYLFKKNLFVGVLTQQEYLATRAKALYETWGREVDKLVLFVGEDCNISSELAHLPIVKLSGIPDHVYPPLLKAFGVMKYMYDHYINDFNWFVRADDDMYVRTKKLQKLLQSMHPYEKVYLGRAGMGRQHDLNRLSLLPHERYCMGGPGVIFSNAALRGVGPHLNNCLRAVFYHDHHSRNEWNDDDVEIGRCISRKMNEQCSTSAESRSLFQFDYSGDVLNPLYLWSKPGFQELITVHPVKIPDNMRSIHHFYKTLEFEELYEELHNMSGYLNELCETLPNRVAPPPFASAGCNLKFAPHFDYSNISVSQSYGSYIIRKRQLDYIHNPINKYDLAYWTRFDMHHVQEMSTVTPQHAPFPGLKAEIQHMVKLLEPYVVTQYKPKAAKIVQVAEGYTRFSPFTGREYLLTLKLELDGSKDQIVTRKLRMVRPLSPEITVVEEQFFSRVLIHVILPVRRVDDHFREFVAMFADVCLARGEKVHLIIVVFSDTDANAVEMTVHEYIRSYPDSKVSIAIGEGSFTRPRAIDIGMTVLKNKRDLAFLADVDLRITPGFFQRCRTNAVPQNRVYFPAAFWQYNSDYRYKHSEELPTIAQWKGQWAFYNLLLACIFKVDYNAIGGYNGSMYSVELFERAAKSHLDVMQAPDPGLFHIWGPKTCGQLSANRRDTCRQIRSNGGSFDQTDLTDYITELANKKTSSLRLLPELQTS